MKTNNYDAIAGAYDFLSRMVFLRTQVNAQIEQLRYIQAGTSILIVGGGTGWILEEIASIHNRGLKITYVESSAKMLALAEKRNYGKNQLKFVHASIEQFQDNQQFDVVHTAFLFDNFKESGASSVFQLLYQQLKTEGLWLYTDFKVDGSRGGWWKRTLLSVMYAFFKRVARVEAGKMPAMEALFTQSKFHIIEQKRHYRGFIESIIFQKCMKIPTFIENLES